jgi:CRP-like cAMP-binding protein
VVQGKLRAQNYSVTGKEVSYHDIGPGEIFGEFSAIDGNTRSTDIFALNDAFIGSLSPDKFWIIVNKHPEVGASLLRRLTHIIRLQNERIFEYSTLAVNNRIHAELLRLAYANGVQNNQAKIAPSPTHAEIASRVSTNREAVTRELSSMVRAGILQKETRALVINDVAALHESLAQQLGEFTHNLLA